MDYFISRKNQDKFNSWLHQKIRLIDDDDGKLTSGTIDHAVHLSFNKSYPDYKIAIVDLLHICQDGIAGRRIDGDLADWHRQHVDDSYREKDFIGDVVEEIEELNLPKYLVDRGNLKEFQKWAEGVASDLRQGNKSAVNQAKKSMRFNRDYKDWERAVELFVRILAGALAGRRGTDEYLEGWHGHVDPDINRKEFINIVMDLYGGPEYKRGSLF